MSSSDQLDPSEVHVETRETQTLPTVSGLVTSYVVSKTPGAASGGCINSAYLNSNDDDAVYRIAPFNSIRTGKSNSYAVHDLNVAKSPSRDNLSEEKKSKCCSKSNSCLRIGLIIGGVFIVLLATGLIIGLVLGLSKKGNESPSAVKTLYLAGTMRLNVSWVNDLAYQSSGAYRMISSEVFAAVSWVMDNSSFSSDFILHEVINLKKGSVLASFRLDVNVTNETPSEILAVLQDGFRMLIDMGAIPVWYLDPKSDIWIEVCNEDEFWCSDGSCLMKKFVCDKINDCGNYSEERNCTCLKTDFRCDMGTCIDGWRQCDNVYDCPDKSDEINCICPMGQFVCKNGSCIMAEWVCDREKDCLDAEDENSCGKCSPDQFLCRDYTCVSNSSRCNGITDCPDISDEDHCVRLDTNLVVQGLSNSTWLPICSDAIPDDVSNLLCLALGTSGMISKSSVYYESEIYLKYDVNENYNLTTIYNLMASFQPKTGCPNNLALVLHCATRTCGVSTLDSVPQGLIAHGTDAPPGKWPWQAAIYKNLAFVCGGSLVDQYHVVTAAHCLADLGASYAVLLGSNLRSLVGSNGQFRIVKLIEIHPKYERYYDGYDIAMLTLREPVNFTDYIRPICLTEPEDEVPLSSLCYSSGWGNTDYNRSDYLPEVLQQAKMRLWSLEDCQLSYPYATHLMLCAGYPSGYIANCAGDSGGPLVCQDSRGFWKLVGVFSFLTKGCSVPLKPSVFTNVQEFYSWIKDKMTCKFFCANGKCVWDLRSLCDGVDDCGDLTDEQRTCNPNITCNFEESYICGYRNVDPAPLLGIWTRKSGPAGVNEGPITDATYGNKTGHYMYSATRWSILLAPIYNETEAHCLQFKLNVRATQCGFFRVFLQPAELIDTPPRNISLENITIIFELPPDFCSLDLWQVMVADIGPGRFLLGLEAYASTGQSSSSIAVDDIKLLNGTCSSQTCNANTEFTCVMDGVCIPIQDRCDYYTKCFDISDELDCLERSYTCDFERYGACGLEQSVLDTGDWMVRPAVEAASIAGCPKFDHTATSPLGNIFFMSTLYGNSGDHAQFSLPIKTSSSPGCLRMYYSMISQGRLKVDFVSASNEWIPVWSVTKVNISDWQLLQLVLPVGVSLININGLNGIESDSAVTSYIAIDDISISEGNCSAPVCTSHQFGCDDGLCIYHEHVCDGIDDCLDNSDEKPALCVCRPESFYCASGDCLQGHVRCDGIRNCKDGSDELNCHVCDEKTEYRCASDGRCKLRSTWCDGTIDCDDGSDERQNCSCFPEQFRCDNGHCILALEYCNGIIDCADASDEPVGCSCSKVGLLRCSDGTCFSPCNLVHNCNDRSDKVNCTQYRCLNGSTISTAQQCDGIVDCSYAEDEQNCVCGPTDFQCTAGRCISRQAVCNGIYDCPDLSDERNCTCSSNQVKCSTGLCLPSYARCNGYNDCQDYSDERNCTCIQDQFLCANGICLYKGFRCNYNDDCGDNSDELNCTCKPKETRCSDGSKCIQQEWLCDGNSDCKDGSDEFNCSSCDNSTQFTCRLDYTCIPLSLRCDGKADCHDSSDEHGCVVQRAYNGTGNILYGYRNGSFYPLCTEFWSEEWSVGVCTSFGSDDTIAISYISLTSVEVFLKIESDSAALSYNLSYLQLTSNCSHRNAVRLTCMRSSCGQPTYSSIVPYIIRGDVATEGQWPWAVALQYNGVYQCSAVLVSEGWIMTAAHCIRNTRNGFSLASVPQYFTAVLGTTKRVGYSSHLQIATFQRIFTHPDYEIVNNVHYNDIALLQISNHLTISDFVNPVCLPKTAWPGLLCFAAGWGITVDSNFADPAFDLRQAKMEVWTYETCSRTEFWGSRVNNETQLCAGYATGYIAMCLGDSGGPLMCRDLNNRWTLRGIVSTGTNPCVQNEPSKPTLFTNVDFFMPWITSIVGKYRR